MAAQDCIDTIQAAAKAAGRELSLEEMIELQGDLTARIKQLQATDGMLGLEDAAMRAADEMGNQVKLAAAIEKRNALLNARRRAELVGYIRSTWSDRPDLGLESFLVGTNVARPGARRSVAAEQKQLSQAYIAGFLHDIDAEGLRPFLTKGDLDADIADALWRMGMDKPLDGLSKEAQGIAKIMHKYQETARIDANRAGAFIRKLPGYVVRQSHDPYKLKRAKFKQWRDDILPLLDERTFEAGSDADEFLLATYNGLVSGVHLKVSAGQPSGFKGPRNLAKKVSAERVLHFKDGLAWDQYNKVYGTGSLREAFLGGLDRSGDSTGMMRRLGTNPESNWNAALDELQKDLKNDPDGLDKFDNDRKGLLKTRFAEVDGTSRMAVNHVGARVAANVRAWQSMAKLGGAVISAVTDLPVAASEMRYQGKGMLSSMGTLIGGMVKGKKSAEQKEILSTLGVFFDSVRGEVVSKFSADDTLGGKMSRAQQLFFKMNGLTWWTDTMRSTAALMMSHHLAYNRTLAWDKMSPDLQRTLELFDIDAGKWELLRSTPSKEADGREYMTTQGIDNIPEEDLAGYLASKGRTANAAAIGELREELRGSLRSYITDRASYAVIEPDARTRAIMRRGTQPGTVAGELLRFLGQFKAFPVAVLQKSIGRELYGRGYKPSAYGAGVGRELLQSMRSGNGEKLGVAQLMLWTTLFGYGAMALKDIVKGREPRPVDDPKTWVAAMLQGGALGLYGDFLFGEANRFGGGLTQSLSGPTLGLIDGGYDLFARMRDGDDAAAASFRFAIQNTPFANLFYTRTAMDYLFLHSVQEALNPGALRRMERRIEKENAQQFLLRPSQTYQDPLGIAR
ncbi:hypothetical protein MT1_3723 [Pseudomonas sp. MT-1]|uniref:hypothetical protein n=1 Tax=Stutzerimonas stutzeri TaxID=316 RepID=UPI000535B7A7|nr:hypothetical protein [Stutzerimonas stutzeri]MCQ4282548.1 hypothetical protein [Stutzerimonas stutzeri]BAP80898.1 hypothetical protein MT1_3723 [Pseudomonas sp. MT-1]